MGRLQERGHLGGRPSSRGACRLKRLLVTGGSGLVGGSVCALAAGSWQVHGTYHRNKPSLFGVDWRQLDITNASSVEALTEAVKPHVIIHTAAIADIDACEKDPETAWRSNVAGTANVARAAEAAGSRLIHMSTSNVFDGEKGDYLESDPVAGTSVYSKTKIASEAEALACRNTVIIRTSLVLGFPKTGGRSFLSTAVRTLEDGRTLPLPANEIRSPIDVWTISSSMMELGELSETGIFHIAGIEKLSRYEMGLKIADKTGCDHSLVVPVTETPPDRAPRPRDSSLDTSKARAVLRTSLPDCSLAIDRAFWWAERRPKGGSRA